MKQLLKFVSAIVLISLPVGACAQLNESIVDLDEMSLAEARVAMSHNVVRMQRQKEGPPKPDKSVMRIVKYPTNLGEMVAYLTNIPKGDDKFPAIIWVSGGDMAIGNFWDPAPRRNDQTAAAFREHGVITMYPALRGLNSNPGFVEGYFGELDDIRAATEWLKKQPNIDPDRVYLGGHSTGGTLVLLASAYADDWAGVFSFGPVSNPKYYGPVYGPPLKHDDRQGYMVRAPIYWLQDIKNPTYVIEGYGGNADDVVGMSRMSENPALNFRLIEGCDHFDVLRPMSEIIARSIVLEDLDHIEQASNDAGICKAS